jgi:hypothetical protein
LQLFYQFLVEIFEKDLIAVGHLGGVARIESWKDSFRKATPEEIEKASTIEIGGYEVKINSYQIEINNITYGKGQLLDLRTLMKLGQIKSLNVGCSGQYTVDLELLEKIIEKF